MAAMITRAAIGATLLIMFVGVSFLFLVQMGNEYDVNLGNEYDGRFGVQLSQNNVQIENNISSIASDSSAFLEGGDLNNEGFDAAQSPGSISATQNLLTSRDILTSFASDFNSVGLAFSPIILYSLMTILVIGIMVSFMYIFFKVIP